VNVCFGEEERHLFRRSEDLTYIVTSSHDHLCCLNKSGKSGGTLPMRPTTSCTRDSLPLLSTLKVLEMSSYI